MLNQWAKRRKISYGNVLIKTGFFAKLLRPETASSQSFANQHFRPRAAIFILYHVHCDQIARLFSDTWPFISMEICLMAYKICPRRPKMLPNKQEIISQNCPRLGIFCQSSEISPNLVTLIPFTSICLLLFSQLMLIWLHLPT